jgi:hypothetical protein
MRTILGYVDGKPQWSDNVPSTPGPRPVRGSLVVGEDTQSAQARWTATYRAKKRAEKAAA